jgi:trehalose 6-phosphate synthase
VHYLHQPVGREELVALYGAADVMVVTPLRDGMNLVCKEYVATRHDLDGVLVLSEFTGAAAELTDALLVNPHDLNGVADALERALTMDPVEERSRMRNLHRQVMTHDVSRWARSFLDFLEPAVTTLTATGTATETDTVTETDTDSVLAPAPAKLIKPGLLNGTAAAAA